MEFLYGPERGDAPTPVRPVGARSWPHIDRETLSYELTRALLMLVILGIGGVTLYAVHLILDLCKGVR